MNNIIHETKSTFIVVHKTKDYRTVLKNIFKDISYTFNSSTVVNIYNPLDLFKPELDSTVIHNKEYVYQQADVLILQRAEITEVMLEFVQDVCSCKKVVIILVIDDVGVL